MDIVERPYIIYLVAFYGILTLICVFILVTLLSQLRRGHDNDADSLSTSLLPIVASMNALFTFLSLLLSFIDNLDYFIENNKQYYTVLFYSSYSCYGICVIFYYSYLILRFISTFENTACEATRRSITLLTTIAVIAVSGLVLYVINSPITQKMVGLSAFCAILFIFVLFYLYSTRLLRMIDIVNHEMTTLNIEIFFKQTALTFNLGLSMIFWTIGFIIIYVIVEYVNNELSFLLDVLGDVVHIIWITCVWLSFEEASNDYYILCGKCHEYCLAWHQKKAHKNTRSGKKGDYRLMEMSSSNW